MTHRAALAALATTILAGAAAPAAGTPTCYTDHIQAGEIQTTITACPQETP